jgi:hypothetical protein
VVTVGACSHIKVVMAVVGRGLTRRNGGDGDGSGRSGRRGRRSKCK